MKIGIVTNLYPPYARGGAENVIVRTVEELLARGHEVFVITGQPRKQGRGIVVDGSSPERIYRFFPRNLYFTTDDFRHSWPVRLLWHIIDTLSWSGASAVRDILRREAPDIVVTHNLKGLGINIPRVVRDEGVPQVHVLHDVQLVFPSGLLMFGREQPFLLLQPFLWLYRFFCRRAFGNPALVISPSEYLRSVYRQYSFFPSSEMIVLRNPVPNYPLAPRKKEVTGGLKLMFAGQLAHHKGVMFLLEAFKRLPAEAILIIVGDGSLRRVVEKAARADARIRYLGYMSPSEIGKLFGIVDAAVVPSLCYENSPTVIYESLQAGIPVIASRIGGVGELVEEGKNGELFTPGDEADFLRAVQVMAERRQSYLQSAEAIKASVAPYALSHFTDTFIGHLTRIVGDLKK